MREFNRERGARRCLAWLMLGAVLMGATGGSHALVIQYQMTDLMDVMFGEDLWQADYFVSGGSFLTDEGFYIEFDYNLFSDLQDPPAFVNGDWDPAVAQPDVGLLENGLYDALALTDNPSLADAFSLAFVWLDPTGVPESQPYTVYDASFTPIFSDNTVPLVSSAPVPPSALLFAIGLLGMAAARSRAAAAGSRESIGNINALFPRSFEWPPVVEDRQNKRSFL